MGALEPNRVNREEIVLELDRVDRRFPPGHPIAGRVRLGPATKSAGRPLVVAVWWQTTGAGDVDRGAERVVELAAPGTEIAGRTFAFSMPAAPGPFSYRGVNFSVEWRVEARLGGSGGVSSSEAIVVEADPGAPLPGIAAAQLAWGPGSSPGQLDAGTDVLSRDQLVRRLEAEDGRDRRAEPAGLGCAVFIGMGFLLFPLLLVADMAGAGDWVNRYVVVIYLAVSLAALAGVLAWLSRSRRGERDLGLTLGLAERIVRPGEDLVCTLGVHPVRRIDLSAAGILVIADETAATTGAGEAGSETRAEVFRSTVAISPARTFPADVPEKLVVRVPLPREAPVSFQSARHRVAWRALVTLQPVRGTLVARKLSFVVHPAGSREGSRPAG